MSIGHDERKYKIDFIDRETGKFIFSREMEFPLEKHSFTQNLHDLEMTLHYRDKDRRLIAISSITTLQDIPIPALDPNNSPIKKGDVVWCDWDHVRYTYSPEKIERLVRDYRPLWELSSYYSVIMERVLS